MTEEVFNLDRQLNIDNNRDALGKKWEVHKARGSSLFHVRPNPDRPDAVIPKIMGGKWTKEYMLRDQIKAHCVATWDQAEVADVKAERKREVTRESKKTTVDKKDEKSFIDKVLNKE